MKVAIASRAWGSTNSHAVYAARVMEATRSVGVESFPIPVASYRGARIGGVVLPAIQGALGSYGSDFVHETDHLSMRGVRVITIQDLRTFHLTERDGWAEQMGRRNTMVAIRRARRVVVTTEAMRAEMVRLLPEFADKSRVVPIPHGPVTHERTEASYDGLWIGMDAPNKRLPDYLGLAERFPQKTFAVSVSGGVFRTKPPRNLHVFDRPLSDTELDRLYRSARVMVSTSTYEGFHLPIAEGYLRGCHIVVPRIEPYLSIYPERAAFWYEPSQSGSVDAAFAEAVSTPTRPPMQAVRESMSYQNVGTQLKAVYEETLSS